MSHTSRILSASLFFILIFILNPFPKSVAQINATGFVRNYNAIQLRQDPDLLIGRNRLRLNLDKSLSFGEIRISNDLQQLYGSSFDSLQYQLREAYIEFYFKNSDLKIGRQLISWGRADGTFITDILAPVDLSEFLTQDFEDLRLGTDALSYIHYFGSNYLQMVVNPVFNPNEVPEFGDRWFPRTFFDNAVPVRFQQFDEELRLEDFQIGGRFALRSNINFDLDIGLLYWHYPNPSYSKSLVLDAVTGRRVLRLEEVFTKSFILTYSGTIQIADGLLFTSESAFYAGRSFDYLTRELRSINFQNPSSAEQVRLVEIFNNNTDGFLKERPWVTAMVGLEYDLWNWTISAQLADEFIFNHDEQMLQEKHFNYTTLRIQKSFFRDNISFRGFGRYNFDGNDFWISPEVTYKGIDNFEASLGTQLFGGEEPERFYGHLSFREFAQNTFGYLKVSLFY